MFDGLFMCSFPMKIMKLNMIWIYLRGVRPKTTYYSLNPFPSHGLFPIGNMQKKINLANPGKPHKTL